MTYAAEVLADTPLLYWRLDESSGTAAADASGNSRPGTYTGTFTLGGSSPIVSDPTSRSVALDGSTGLIAASYNPFTGQRTFEGWAYRTNHSTLDALFGSAGGNCKLGLNNNAAAADVRWWPNTALGSNDWAGAWPGDAQWVHWALAHDDGAHTATLWINGVNKGTLTGVTAYSSPGNFIAGARGGPQDPFVGSLDEIAVYPALLTNARVLAHYQAATLPPPGGGTWSVIG